MNVLSSNVSLTNPVDSKLTRIFTLLTNKDSNYFVNLNKYMKILYIEYIRLYITM